MIARALGGRAGRSADLAGPASESRDRPSSAKVEEAMQRGSAQCTRFAS